MKDKKFTNWTKIGQKLDKNWTNGGEMNESDNFNPDDFYIAAEVRPKNHNAKSNIYVEYHVKSLDTGEWRRVRVRRFYKYKTYQERIAAAHAYCQAINEHLKAGMFKESIERGVKPTPVRLSLIDSINEVVKRKENTYKNKNSFITVKSMLNRFNAFLVKHHGENPSPRVADKGLAIAYMNELKKNKKLSNSSYNSNLAQLKSVFNQLVESDVIEKNPFLVINKLPSDNKSFKVYSQQELTKVASLILEEDYGLYIMLHFIGYAFLRPIEAMRLKVGDIDRHKNLIMLGGESIKTSKRISIPIIQSFRPKLYDFIDAYPKGYYVFGGNMTPAKEAGNRQLATKRFTRIRKRAGLSDDFKLYGLRHTFISDLYNSFLSETGEKESAMRALMNITRHSTLAALESYLREIGAVTPDDYSSRYTLKI